jgi:uncharacterized protein (TIGR03118 family)
MEITMRLNYPIRCAALAATAWLAACGGGGSGGTTMNSGATMNGGTGYVATGLVADTGSTNPYNAMSTSASLVNAWGVAFNPQGFAWVADEGTSKSTLYDGNGAPQSLVVTIPAGAAGAARPTGIVFNPTGSFAVSQGGTSAPSAFIFVGLSGTVSGWAPSVNATAAVTAVDLGASHTVYTGLALTNGANGPRLYAADFAHARVDVYDGNFAPVVLPAGAFQDANLPAGYAPFGIQAIGGLVYVAYAQPNPNGEPQEGAGLGALDVYDASGVLQTRLVAAGGPLNAPWGIAMAPAGFGQFSGDLLVGDFGDGQIHAFDPATGAHQGVLTSANGTPIAIDGLWGLAFGNGLNSQPTTTLFFAAGPLDETHGVYGRIDVQ